MSEEKYIASIDQGTSSSRFCVFNKAGQCVAFHQVEIKQFYPKPGWVEEDPEEILNSVIQCIETVLNKFDKKLIVGCGITNQRETTVLFDKNTGKALYNAIVWLDTRSTDICQQVIKENNNDSDCFRSITGLPINSYFSASKIKWLIQNVKAVQDALKSNSCLFGTIETWLLYRLTLEKIHITDITNASRTLLMDLESCNWSKKICEKFNIPLDILPNIKSCSEIYGHFNITSLQGIPLCGCLGDQQAALLGNLCLQVGQAKNTYGTGCFLLINTGNKFITSKKGLLSTVAFKLGVNEPTFYALEGSISIAGVIVKWLRDNLNLIANSNEVETAARSVLDNGGVYFVPAFNGLFAPYWQSEARGLIIGLTQHSNKGHICRAALEAVCSQVTDIVAAIEADSKITLSELKVDGGMTVNSLLMQTQADFLNKNIVKPESSEATARGAAFAAGLAVKFWSDIESLKECISLKFTNFSPMMDEKERKNKFDNWHKAVERTFNWL